MVARIAWTVVLALAVFVPQSFVGAQMPAQEVVTLHGLTFPASIAGAERFEVRDYEKDNRGYGYGVGYRHPAAVMTVYIYDLKQRNIPDDPAAPAIREEFKAASAELFRTQREAFHRKVEPKGEFSIADVRNRKRFLCAVFSLASTTPPTEKASYLCVGGWNNKFVKFRITGEQYSQADADRFVRAWMDLLWWP